MTNINTEKFKTNLETKTHCILLQNYMLQAAWIYRKRTQKMFPKWTPRNFDFIGSSALKIVPEERLKYRTIKTLKTM